MAYKAPIWEDGNSPAISAENLNALSQAAEGAQVLYGNSAPTSSTEGAVGQFYLVVVADSDGNYPLYQCVAIANGSYTWRDTRRIPDSITSMLGIPAPGTINSALNVLANIGNVHVWSRTITLTDSTYKPVVGEDNYSVTLNPGDKLYYSDSVDIASLQDINLASPVSTFSFDGYSVPSVVGKYIRKNDDPTIYIYPASDQSIAGSTLWLRNCHEISAAVDTPAGTHTDFVTSTDSTAYPRDGDVGDCHYTYLGQLGGGARIEVGSYVGTGTFGASNPTSITVEFTPKMLFVGAVGRNSGTILFCEAYSSEFQNAACLTFNVDFVQTNDVYASKTGNTVKWYATKRSQSTYLDTDIQSNRSGITYHYIAIG